MLAVAGAILAIPGLAVAGSGGAGTSSSGSPNVAVQPGNVPVTATSNGITLDANASAFVRSGVSITGSVPGADAGDAIEIDQLGTAPATSWVRVAIVRAASNGSFAAAWHTGRAGQFTIRAVLQANQASSAAASPPAVSVTVYRRSIATLYGPGFYGARTACGVVLRRRTVGVANRTLPCGTEVQVYYNGNVATVPVIDRGPYAHNANWDLTMATGRALGMLGTAVIGAASTPPTSTPPTSTPSTSTPPASPAGRGGGSPSAQ
ncbi:MAG: hypothetical protein JO046_19400 [Solirubrobacterales bacterium]|nr:hypothetical protein [Solirubrobacterales bacterium]